jgi:hypothetical protein
MGADGGNDTRVVNNAGRLVQSFLLRNGTYDFSRDRAGTTFMEMASQYNVPEITFFVNAAPSNISTNGAACGWDMPREKVPQFVDYIVKVLAYWTGQGIGIKWISPMNEPDVSRSDCGQEGMFVGITKRPYVFSTLRAALDNNSVSNAATAVRNISIMGDETSQVTTETFLEYPLWLPAAKNSLNGISVHNYDFPDDLSLGLYRTLLNLEVGPNGPPVKFTETCCSTRTGSGIPVFGSQYDPTMQVPFPSSLKASPRNPLTTLHPPERPNSRPLHLAIPHHRPSDLLRLVARGLLPTLQSDPRRRRELQPLRTGADLGLQRRPDLRRPAVPAVAGLHAALDETRVHAETLLVFPPAGGGEI